MAEGARDRIRRWHSPTVFTLVALCFLLPFFTVSVSTGCDPYVSDDLANRAKDSFTGIQLVTHAVPRATVFVSDPDTHGIAGDVEKKGATTTEIAFAAAIVGLVLGLLGVARGPGFCAAVGIGALVLLPVMLTDYSLSPRAGYWLALAFFGWAGILHFIRRQERIRAARATTGPDPPPS